MKRRALMQPLRKPQPKTELARLAEKLALHKGRGFFCGRAAAISGGAADGRRETGTSLTVFFLPKPGAGD